MLLVDLERLQSEIEVGQDRHRVRHSGAARPPPPSAAPAQRARRAAYSPTESNQWEDQTAKYAHAYICMYVCNNMPTHMPALGRQWPRFRTSRLMVLNTLFPSACVDILRKSVCVHAAEIKRMRSSCLNGSSTMCACMLIPLLVNCGKAVQR